KDFAALNGYKEGWGYISADGSLANMEGLWYARNVKSLPLAMKKVAPELVSGKSDWELLNMPTHEMLDLLDKADPKVADKIKNNSARAGHDMDKLGK
ncbi:tyrosine decarboxylase, partial [Eggerthella lenta]|nr:tyrosine decarboxylase [Eggerthella lenta]